MHLTSVRSTYRVVSIVTGNSKCFMFMCQPYAEEGTELLEKAATQARARVRHVCVGTGVLQEERARASHEMAHQGRRGRVAVCEFSLGTMLDMGEGRAAPDYPAAAGWYRRAVDAGIGDAAHNLSTLYTVGPGQGLDQNAAMSSFTSSST